MSRKKMKVAYLGPSGSFSHEATVLKFSKYDLIQKDTLENVFECVYVEEADYGVLPVENSTQGIIALTYHKLVEQGKDPKIKFKEKYTTILLKI